jgi:hypothetical protein
MLLYHGSNMSVEQPKIRKLRAMDFGFGFYLTSNEKQAAQFAEKVVIREERLNNSPGIPTVNVYECSFEEAMLAINVLKFEAPDEKWLDFVVANRMGKSTEENYDIVIGSVANDDVFEVIRIYEAGTITKEMALAAMKIKKLFNQYVLKTERGLSLLQFMNAYEVKQ